MGEPSLPFFFLIRSRLGSFLYLGGICIIIKLQDAPNGSDANSLQYDSSSKIYWLLSDW